MTLAAIMFSFTLSQCSQELPRVYYINSYHPGYATSDEIEEAVRTILNPKLYEVKVFHLDAKQLSRTELKSRATQAWNELVEFKPDIVLCSDDNAVADIIVPHQSELTIPVLFCGVNWSAANYRLSPNKMSGMIEVLPVQESLRMIRDSGYSFDRVTVISEESIAEEKNKAVIEPRLRAQDLAVDYVMVSSLAQWKDTFLRAQQDSSIIYLPTNGAIAGWDQAEVVAFIHEHMRVPIFTCDDFMMPYAAIGLTKVASEQGEWMATQAIKVLAGTPVSSIKETTNKQFNCFINPTLLERTPLVIKTPCTPYEDAD